MSTVRAAAVAVAALLLASALPAETRNTVGIDRWIVGFADALPVPGEAFAGGAVLRVDAALRFAVVLAGAGFPARAAQEPGVRYVEPDLLRDVLLGEPDDARWSSQYGPSLVGAPAAWDTSPGVASVAVCHVDTGLRATHEDLAGPRYAGGHDFQNGDPDPADDHGHGTHVTGTTAATTGNGLGIAGIAQVSFKHAKATDHRGRAHVSNVASAIAWCADHGAHVLSLSIGDTTPWTSWRDAVDHAHAAGALVVAAAGNAGCDSCVVYPAAWPNAVAVGCVTPAKALCSFSSRGPEVELVAPGFDVYATHHAADDAYLHRSGTSMATPHVAGVAALVKSVEPHLPHEEIRARLAAEAEDLGDPGRDEAHGFGLVRADRAIGNLPPVLVEAGCAPASAPAGKRVLCAFRATDAPGGVFFTVDWGDGSAPERIPAEGSVPAGNEAAALHAFPAGGPYAVVVTATDTHARPATSAPRAFAQETTPNGAPATPEIRCPEGSVGRGRVASCDFRATDDSDGLAFLVDWGDGTPEERWPASGHVAPGATLRAARPWPAPGQFTVAVRAVDDGDPPRSSAAATAVVRVVPCALDATAEVPLPGGGLALDGLTSRLVLLPDPCDGEAFALRGTDGLDDFDVCWYGGDVELACHRSRGDEVGSVPAGADRARVHLVLGDGGAFRLVAPE